MPELCTCVTFQMRLKKNTPCWPCGQTLLHVHLMIKNCFKNSMCHVAWVVKKRSKWNVSWKSLENNVFLYSIRLIYSKYGMACLHSSESLLLIPINHLGKWKQLQEMEAIKHKNHHTWYFKQMFEMKYSCQGPLPLLNMMRLFLIRDEQNASTIW